MPTDIQIVHPTAEFSAIILRPEFVALTGKHVFTGAGVGTVFVGNPSSATGASAADSLGLNIAFPATPGTMAGVMGANGATAITWKAANGATTGAFSDFQTFAGLSKFKVDVTGRIDVNLNAAALPAPPSFIESVGAHFGGEDNKVFGIVLDSFGQPAQYYFRRANGTNAAPSQVTSGNVIAALQGEGRTNAGAWSGAPNAAVWLAAAENFTASANGTTIRLRTTPLGSTAMADTMTIGPSGVRVGTVADPGAGSLAAQNALSSASANVAGPVAAGTIVLSTAPLASFPAAGTLQRSGDEVYVTGGAYRDRINPRVASQVAIKSVQTWIPRTVPDEWWIACEWSPELKLFCAVGYRAPSAGPTQARIMTSPNGRDWTSRTSPIDVQLHGLIWVPTNAARAGRFVATANTGTGQRVVTSVDGETWIARTTPADNSWQQLTYSPELDLVVAVADTGTGNRVMTSSDGGETWSIGVSPADNEWSGIIWAKELGASGLFVVVARTGANRVMTSPDGLAWTLRTAANAALWDGLGWSPETGMLVAVAYTGGTGGQVMTSTDAITWISRSAANANDWSRSKWSPRVRLWVAAAPQGASARIMTSPDGITWTAQSTGVANTTNWVTPVWADELGIWCVIGYGSAGAGGCITSSPLDDHQQYVSIYGRGSMQPISGGLVLQENTLADPRGLGLDLYHASGAANTLIFRKSRHPSIGSHTIVQSGDFLGGILFHGSDGAAWQNAAFVRAAVDGTPGASDMPGRLEFGTTPDGSNAALVRVTITNAGNVQVGGTALRATPGTKGIDIFEGTPAAGALSNGVTLQCIGGHLVATRADGETYDLTP